MCTNAPNLPLRGRCRPQAADEGWCSAQRIPINDCQWQSHHKNIGTQNRCGEPPGEYVYPRTEAEKPSPAGEGPRRSGGMWRGHLLKVPEFVRKERRKMDPQTSVEVRQFRKVSPPHPACGPPSPSRRRLGASPSGYTNSPGVSPPGTSYRPHQSGLRPASFPKGKLYNLPLRGRCRPQGGG